jgi:hypothetical protein
MSRYSNSQQFLLLPDVSRPGNDLILVAYVLTQPIPGAVFSIPDSDYQDPLRDSAGHDRTVRLIRADTSRGYVLVPEGSGCFK